MKRYYAKPETWFKEGTECFREEEMYKFSDGSTSAIYRGIYVVGSSNPDGYDKYWYEKGYKDGDEVEMGEHCCDDEFDVVE